MTTQCTLKWSFVLLLGTTLIGNAQNSANPVQDAAEHAVRQQEKTLIMKQRISDAREAQRKGDLNKAATLYEAAYKLSTEIGAGIDNERRQIVGGLTYVRLQLAQNAHDRGDYQEA